MRPGSRLLLLMMAFAVAIFPLSIAAQSVSDADTAALKQRGFEFYFAGKYAETLPVAKEYAEHIQKRYGPAHPEYATALYYIAEVLRVSDRLADAEDFSREALVIDEKALGPDHPAVARDLNLLATVLRDTNRLAEAEPLARRVLAIDADLNGLKERVGAFYREGRYGDAIPLAERYLEGAKARYSEAAAEYATGLNNLGHLFQVTNQLVKAEPLMRQALALYEARFGPDNPNLTTTLNNLGELFRDTSRFAEAELFYRRALAIDEKSFGSDHQDVARDLNNLAVLFERMSRLAEAEPLLRRSLAIQEQSLGPNHPAVALCLQNLAMLLNDIKQLHEAERLLRRALEIDERSFGINHSSVARNLSNLAVVLINADRLAEAEPLLSRALVIGEKSLGPNHPSIVTELLKEQQGKWLEAAALFARAKPIMIGIDSADAYGRSDLRKIILRQNTASFRGFARVLYHADAQNAANLAEAFELAQWALQNSAADALTSLSVRFAKEGSQLTGSVRQQQDLIANREVAYRNLDAAEARADTNAAEIARAAIAEVEAAIVENKVRLSKDSPDYAELADPKPLSLTDAQALLNENQTLILFLDLWQTNNTPEETLVFALTKKQTIWTSIPLGIVELSKRVSTLRCGLDSSNWQEGIKTRTDCKTLLGVEVTEEQVPPFDAAAAYALYRDLFAPIEALVKDKRLLIVPSGPLTQLPFEVLVTAKPDEALPSFEAYKKAAWLGQRQAITILPSVGSLKALRTSKASAAPEPFIGLGNPLLTGIDGADKSAWAKQDCSKPAPPKQSRIAAIAASIISLFRGGAVDVEDLRRQPPLPETADELCAVGRELGVPEAGLKKAVHLGERATVSEVKALSKSGNLASARVVHFATHGLLAGETALFAKNKAEPALLLTPPSVASDKDNGLLTASEVARLNLNADWVVMSACNTAGGSAEGAEALSGLARAFFYAGARSLLVSHWYVESEAAVAITTGAVKAMKAEPGIGRAEALRRAEAALIARGGRFAHPSVWAPFVLVGNGEQ